ncbi:MAG: thioredoxin domain-containing protein, partial [Myxococcota bacterium]
MVPPVSPVMALLACSWFTASPVVDAVPGVDRSATLEAELRQHLDDPDAPFVNRLARSDSPYLRDHATNPVDWYEWGDEAFALAKRDNRLVFLSIGYATCHWCHVMAHESFEDEAIAAVLNRHYVAIKVDREQRPDIDEIYMDAVQLLRGRGGWPLTAILTPDGEPVVAATYIPARDGDRGARRGLLSILEELRHTWAEEPDRVLQAAQDLTQRLVTDARPAPPGDVPGVEVAQRATERLLDQFDPVHAGFGDSPKFPVPLKLDLLLTEALRRGDDALREPVLATLGAMLRGGLHDPIEGGFHRYATDRAWRVPHFEKMLYDNAQLLSTYARATAVTGRDDLRWVTRRTATFLVDELATSEGPFIAALDADSPGPDGAVHEGLYYTFTPDEVAQAVPPADVPFALAHFGITGSGQLEGRSVPSLVEATAPPWSDPRAQTVADALRGARTQRPPPARDHQVIVAWNALAIS